MTTQYEGIDLLKVTVEDITRYYEAMNDDQCTSLTKDGRRCKNKTSDMWYCMGNPVHFFEVEKDKNFRKCSCHKRRGIKTD